MTETFEINGRTFEISKPYKDWIVTENGFEQMLIDRAFTLEEVKGIITQDLDDLLTYLPNVAY